MTGQLVGPYLLHDQLGAGGMGVVYAAEDTRLGRHVALKFLPAPALQSPDALERFQVEARAASALSHPGICAIHDIGVHEGAPYLVMELVKGETLRDRIARGALRISDVLDIGILLADALAAAHALGIVHRDLKPANIVLDDKLRPKLLDFGLAKFMGADSAAAPDDITLAGGGPAGPGAPSPLTMAGTTLGTVAYMSPEQARAEEIDARTDVFSLGVVLYEMVTGQQAFGGSTTAVVFDAILNRAPISPAVLKPDTPPRLVDAIHTALEKDRGLRYQHAEELEAELKRIRRDLQSSGTGSLPARAADAPTVAVPSPAPASGPSAPASAPAVATGPPRPSMAWLWALVALVAVGSGLWNAGWRPGPATVAVDASRAVQRLEARDYRAALVEATAVLARDPAQADALRVKAAAEAQLAALESLASRVRLAVTAGDLTEASSALTDAQDLAPGDAVVTELSVLVRSANPNGAAKGPAEGSGARAAPSTATVPDRVGPAGALPVAPGAVDDPPVPPDRRDDVAVRRVLDVFRRAVAARDFALFRTIYPDLTAEEEQGFRAGFGPGSAVPLAMLVEQLAIDGAVADARLVFVDPSPTGPARPRLVQQVQLARRGGQWVVAKIGPALRRRPRP